MPKEPQDRKSKAVLANDKTFTFEHDGKAFTSRPLTDVLTPGFIRHNRRLSEMDLYFTMLEEMFADDAGALDAIDGMSWQQVRNVTDKLEAAMGETVEASLGE